MNNKAAFVSPTASTTWQLRTHMAFLVDNLQYYLQVKLEIHWFKQIYTRNLRCMYYLFIGAAINVDNGFFISGIQRQVQ